MVTKSDAPFLRRVRLNDQPIEEPVDQPTGQETDGSDDEWDKNDFPDWYQDKVDDKPEQGEPNQSEDDEASNDYALDLPAVQTLDQLNFGPMNILAGNNGAGKSTILEAIAIIARFNPEGGSRNLRFATHDTHSSLADHLVLEWNRNPRWGWFLRAETFYGMASHIEEDEHLAPTFPKFHHRSHGESFLDLAASRFSGAGLYLLDEPESALSIQGLMSFCALMSQSLAKGSQFIISTHSPLLMAFPGAHVFELNAETGTKQTTFESLESTGLWKRFFAEPQDFYKNLLSGQR